MSDIRNKIRDIISTIGCELKIKVTFAEDDVIKYKDFLQYEEDSYTIGNNEIVVGRYNNCENLLISFFHEVGHCLLGSESCRDFAYNTLLIELECWNIGLKEAMKRGINFSDNAIQFGYNKALSYVGHDERENCQWKETQGQYLISKTLCTKEGRRMLAMAMIEPIRYPRYYSQYGKDMIAVKKI